MTPEAALKRDIHAYLATVGAYSVPIVSTGYGRRGIPDILVCYRGYFLALEVKAPGKTATPWQQRELAAIRAAGGRADVVTSVDDVRVWVEAIMEADRSTDEACEWAERSLEF